MAWTNLEALAEAIRRTRTREEALGLVHAAPGTAQEARPDERPVNTAAVEAARAVQAVCRPAAPRPRPTGDRMLMPLFGRTGGRG
jgi:hypothetical protein